MKTIMVKGYECKTAGEAIQWADAGGGEPITIGGKYLVVRHSEFERLQASRVQFAALGCIGEGEHEGRIVTIPIND